ncbi:MULTISPECIES: 4'-phosphopantetheinyl transferase family protein [Olivibacter]|uniref:4'-phosphopantetheinyl transferase family protein n=1 Tax=Olivibacter jilunii TaxID=985016 RepID=A0ABW6B8I0_9SPHI
MEKYAHIHEYDREILLPYSRFFPSNHLIFKTKNTDRKLESLLGLKLLSDLLRKIDSQCQIQDIMYTAEGKPYFRDRNLHISIAHACGMVLVGLGDHSLGLDIEHRQARSPIIPEIHLNKKLLFFTGVENWIKAWVHQEAVLKMFGWGDMNYCQDIIWDSANKGTFADYAFLLQEIEMLPEYYAAKCSLIR